ncbi:hypothetical protein M3221_24020 [Domibacillus indicus]|uniref:hypothetical protein n=1 Tax=Domibacillus indicus TaxID=1437523 RepID=UPI0020416D81|nr:hypothetical protein [Domibacillus indicus]MCM3791400.1 hypothetical protein [Domibacillus indicus]
MIGRTNYLLKALFVLFFVLFKENSTAPFQSMNRHVSALLLLQKTVSSKRFYGFYKLKKHLSSNGMQLHIQTLIMSLHIKKPLK